ncbi:hypothetical protein INR49_009109 [Caranx melampygus]|nr:hypothetical protein INR49_009109 [Caranx melampygus]
MHLSLGAIVAACPKVHTSFESLLTPTPRRLEVMRAGQHEKMYVSSVSASLMYWYQEFFIFKVEGQTHGMHAWHEGFRRAVEQRRKERREGLDIIIAAGPLLQTK